MNSNESGTEQIQFLLLFDEEQQTYVEETLYPLVEPLVREKRAFDAATPEEWTEATSLLLYLSDSQLKSLLPKIASTDVRIAVLPHPQAEEACVGMGIDTNITKAVNHLKETPAVIETDILYCNDHPILNKMIVGHTFQLTSEDSNRKEGYFRQKLNYITRFFRIKPFRVDLELPNDQHIKTAVTGIVVSEHRKSSLLSRLILENSSVNDGMMHGFFIIPRSIMEMFDFAIRSLFGKKRLPSFGAHVKTNHIRLVFPEGARDVLIDNEKFSEAELELRIEKKQIRIFPGAHLELSDTSGEPKEIYKIHKLPTGEAAQELSQSTLPFIRRASSEEFKDLFQTLRDNARLKNSYLVLMVLSTVLATFGLFADSTPVVIGAMILAPLISPVISLSMGTLRQEKKLILDSIITTFAGLGISVLFAVLITWLTPIYTPGSEILNRTRPHLLDLGIAVVSGIAGAYAHARKEVGQTLAGVAIAVALIPPLAVAAIGIGWANWDIFSGAFLLLITNLAGMVLAAALTFAILGFGPFRFFNKGIVISLVVVLLLCVPLVLSFNQMIYEHRIQGDLEGLQTEMATLKDIKVVKISPLRISLKLVSDQPVYGSKIDVIKANIEERLGREVELEVVTVISR